MRFDQFAQVKTDLSAIPGKTITFFKYNNLGAGGLLTEGTPMATKALAGAQLSISVLEYGNAVAVSNMLLVTAFTDVMADTAKLLGQDYAKVVDGLARDTLENGVGSTVFANDAANADAVGATDYLTMEEIKDAIEILATNNAQKINNDHWACFVHPHQSRHLRDDADWVTVGKLDPQRLYNGEIGRIDDVNFIETTRVSVDANAAATPVDIYTALMIGDNLGVEGQLDGQVFSGMGQTLTEECIMENGVVMNPTLLDYKIPRPFEVPEIEYIIVETNDPYGPYGAKEVGQGPIQCTAQPIANAVSNAIGVQIKELPIAPERVLKAIREKK